MKHRGKSALLAVTIVTGFLLSAQRSSAAWSFNEPFDTDTTNPVAVYPQYSWNNVSGGSCQVVGGKLVVTGDYAVMQLFWNNGLSFPGDSTVSADMTCDGAGHVYFDVRGGNSWYQSGIYHSGDSLRLRLYGPVGSVPTYEIYDTGFQRPAGGQLVHMDVTGDGLGGFAATVTDPNNPAATFSRPFTNALIRHIYNAGLIFSGNAIGQTATFDNWQVVPGARGAPDLPAGPTFSAPYDEFAGPFSSWINVQTDLDDLGGPNAVGDGQADDTAALNYALNIVRDGWSQTTGKSVVYLPAGTYKITSTLLFTKKMFVGLIGEDPANTTIRWAGPDGGNDGYGSATNAMLWANGLKHSRVGRITWDGAGSNVVGVANKYKWAMMDDGAYQSSQNFYSDNVFSNMAIGLAIGHPPVYDGAEHIDYGWGDDTMNIVRCRFYRCSQAGIRTGSYNAFNNAAWDCVFADNATGIDDYGGGGGCHVYHCYFQNSSVADIHVWSAFWRTLYGNTSVGSKRFFREDGAAQNECHTVLQDNTILDSQEDTTICFSELGLALLLDNRIRSLAGTVCPVVFMGGADGPDLCSISNRYTGGPEPIFVKGSANERWWTLDDQVVDRAAIPNTLVPALPGTPTKDPTRVVTSLTVNATSTEIQAAIDDAAAHAGQRSVVHIPGGDHSIGQTIIIPANLDIILAGDCRATKLVWTGAGCGPILRLEGPSKATITDIHFRGNGVNAIAIDDPDQIGARIYTEGCFWGELAQYGLLVNHCTNAVVECHNLVVGSTDLVIVNDSFRAVKVNGSGAGTGYTALFNASAGSSATNGTDFEVTNGGRLLVRDYDHENCPAPRLVKLTGDSAFTIADGRFTYGDKTNSMVAPIIELNNFTGKAAFLDFQMDMPDSIGRQILVTGETAGMQALFLGMDACLPDGHTNFFNRVGSGGMVSFLNGKYGTSSGVYYQVPDQGDEPTTNFINSTLEQLRTEKPTYPTNLPASVTDVRLINVQISGLSPVGVRVGATEPPSVSIVNLPDGTVVPFGNALLLEAAANDMDGVVSRVDFYANGVLLYSDTNGADGWNYLWANAPAGYYSLTTVAYDNEGASTTSGVVSIRMNGAYWFNVASGDWNEATRWTPSCVPSTGDIANIYGAGAGYTAAVSDRQAADTVAVGGDMMADEAGVGTLAIETTGSLEAQGLVVGVKGAGTFVQEGGSVTAAVLVVGMDGGSGVYTQLAGRMTISTNAAPASYWDDICRWEGTLDACGTARVVIAGGTLSGNELMMGNSETYTCGSLDISGGILELGNEVIGAQGGSHTIEQSGGTNRVAHALELGRKNSTVLYALTGGRLEAGSVTVGGDRSTGTLTQAGGILVAQTVTVAGGTSGAGAYTVSNGTVAVSNAVVGSASGQSTGTFQVVGAQAAIALTNYTQYAGAKLAVMLTPGGLSPIRVNGTATLAGTLEIGRTSDAYFPAGTVVTVMTYAAHSGVFEQTNFVNGIGCQVNVSSTMITLSNITPAAVNQPPTATLTAPMNGWVTITNRITTLATATDDVSVAQVAWTANGVQVGVDTTAPYSNLWNNVTGGVYTVRAIATDNLAAGTSTPATITVWNTLDIGNVNGKVGRATLNNTNGTAFTVAGGGAGITGTVDACRFLYRAVTGNCTIVARLTNFVSGAVANTRLGVMMRASTNANAIEASVLYYPGSSKRVYFHRRTATGGSTATSYATAGALPYWVKLVRSNNVMKAYSSANGTSWTQVGANTTVTNTLLVGLAVTSGTTSNTKTGTFDNVSITAP